MSDRGPLHKIALASGYFLLVFAVFSAGLWLGQSKKVQAVWSYIQSGEMSAMILPYANHPFDKELTVWKSEPHALNGGAILIGSQYSENPALMLVNEDGNIIHSWHVDPQIYNFETLLWWKDPPRARDAIYTLDDAHLLPNGDVIFIQNLRAFPGYGGQRLARMDKNSQILWQVPGAFSHEIDIVQNTQTIYTIASHIKNELPVIGPKLETINYLDDQIEQYTMDGKKLNSWSIVDAFARSPYRSLLSSFEIDLPQMQRVRRADGQILYDLIHPNSIQYLNAAQAKALPLSQEGDLLISLRGLNALAVFRPSTQQIVWAGQGPWRHQHFPQATDGGELYIFDNDGSHVVELSSEGEPKEKPQSRLLRYNPFNNQTDVIFASTELYSYWRGYYYPLDNGSWIVSSSARSRVVVVSSTGVTKWELRGVPDRTMYNVPILKQICVVRYYPAEALSFLNQP